MPRNWEGCESISLFLTPPWDDGARHRLWLLAVAYPRLRVLRLSSFLGNLCFPDIHPSY